MLMHHYVFVLRSTICVDLRCNWQIDDSLCRQLGDSIVHWWWWAPEITLNSNARECTRTAHRRTALGRRKGSGARFISIANTSIMHDSGTLSLAAPYTTDYWNGNCSNHRIMNDIQQLLFNHKFHLYTSSFIIMHIQHIAIDYTVVITCRIECAHSTAHWTAPHCRKCHGKNFQSCEKSINSGVCVRPHDIFVIVIYNCVRWAYAYASIIARSEFRLDIIANQLLVDLRPRKCVTMALKICIKLWTRAQCTNPISIAYQAVVSVYFMFAFFVGCILRRRPSLMRPLPARSRLLPGKLIANSKLASIRLPDEFVRKLINKIQFTNGMRPSHRRSERLNHLIYY